jgi:hypothetical protein
MAGVRREAEEFDHSERSGLWHDIECSSLRTEVDAMIEQVLMCVYVRFYVCVCMCMHRDVECSLLRTEVHAMIEQVLMYVCMYVCICACMCMYERHD